MTARALRASVAEAASVPQGSSSVHLTQSEDKDLVLVRQIFKAAIEESGEKKEFVAAAIGVDPEYLSKMFSGDKPIQTRHLGALPDQIEAIFARRYAEAFGLVVVTPVVGEAAVHSLVSGLVGLLAPRLPTRAVRMARAELKR